MSDSITTREIIELLASQMGIKKKLAAKILHVIPEIIEEGLKRDGEVRVAGLGTFRLKWTQRRTGRNPKTGERVAIPAHNRLVFLPERSFKDYINEEYRLLGYKVIPGEEVAEKPAEPVIKEPEPEPFPVPGPEPEPLPLPGLQPSLGFQPEPAGPIKRRRIHWIVPVAFLVITVLSLIFYFRNFYQGDKQLDSGQLDSRQLDSGQLDSGQLDSGRLDSGAVPTSRDLRFASIGQLDSGQLAVGQLANSNQDSIEPTQSASWRTKLNPPAGGQNSELVSVAEGKRLFQLAREVYGNPYLWVLIYRENQSLIKDPEILVSGTKLVIPSLEGTPAKLSRNDSLAVSSGYQSVYEFYENKKDPRAEEFLHVAEKYKPK